MCSDALHPEQGWWLEGWGPGASLDRGAQTGKSSRSENPWPRRRACFRGVCGSVRAHLRARVDKGHVHLHVLTDASAPQVCAQKGPDGKTPRSNEPTQRPGRNGGF